MIIFRKVRWQNFLATGNAWNEIVLDSHKSTIIIGDNGAGKSSFLDALVFGLFGRPFRNINKPQLVNTINNKDCMVEVYLSTNNHEYLIRRGLKPNIFEIWEDGIQKDQDSAARDDQTYVERNILKFNLKAFTQIVAVGIGQYIPFMKLPAAHRRIVIEEILDLQIFSVMGTILKERIQDNRDAINEVNSKIQLAEQKIELHNKHLVSMRENTQVIIENKRETLWTNVQESINASMASDRLLEQREELEKSIQDAETVTAKIKQMFHYKQQFNLKKKALSDQINFFQTSDNCPTCTQELNETVKTNEINSRNAKIEELLAGEVELNNKLIALKERDAAINKISEEIDEYNEQMNEQEEICKIKTHYIHELQKELIELEEQHNSYIDETGEMIEFQGELLDYHSQREHLIRDKNMFEFTSSLLSDSGIKSRIIRQYIQIINKLLAKYLAQMDFMVQFELDENFNETIKSRYRDEYSYESFSAGEQLRINVALLFTWRAIAKMRNSASTNLLIMDELFDSSLDQTGIAEFFKILESLTQDQNTFIISHKTELIDRFDQTIRFEKHRNFSKIIQEENIV